jgi:DNA-binding NarL/FixJ family response regulator
MSRAPRAVIADDQPIMRASARRLLEQDGFTVCGEASDADGAVEAAFREAPDICLLGVPIPGDVILATSQIATSLPQTAVVLLTASESRADLVDAIRAGAVGYLLKGMSEERLTSALRSVLAGEAAIPRGLVACLVRELQTQGRRRTIAGEHGHADLTARETEVMELMCEGRSTGEIAERLVLSPVTVRRHISEIVGKLGVDDREEAVALVGRQP